MLHLYVTTLMANGPGFGFSWVKCNMVLSDAKYTDIGVSLFFVPRIYQDMNIVHLVVYTCFSISVLYNYT